MLRSFCRQSWVVALLVCFVCGAPLLLAAKPAARRARPPQWDPKEVSKVFWDDAREKLVGPRPDFGGAPAAPNVAQTTEVAASDDGPGGFAWSKVIGPDALEDEIKSLQSAVSKNVTELGKFKSGGFKEGRRLFSELAVLFGIVAEYDQDVRWKKQAPGIRDLLARAGFNCKTYSDAAYNEAKLRRDDLESLVRGGTIATKEADRKATWDKVAARPPLMQRMEAAHQQGIAVWTSNSGEFAKNAAKLAHEAQVLAAISAVIQKEGYEFADDSTYLEYARDMQNASLEVVGAVKAKNYEQARAASALIGKACSNCHDGYRNN